MSVIEKYDENLYIISDGDNLFVRSFLITGESKNILIDTGITADGVMKEIQKISSAPVEVYLTHGDIDHTGGLVNFRECYINPEDEHMINIDIDKHPVNDGDIVEAGGYCFEVISVPGHTYGSIVFLDKKRRLMLSGDMVQQNSCIYMFGQERNLKLYIESMDKLLGYRDSISTILPSHGDIPVGFEAIENCRKGAEALLDGKIDGEPHPFLPCRVYKGENVGFFY